MTTSRIPSLALAFLLTSTALPAAATPALVVDVETRAVLGAEEAGRPWYPASTAKLMTAYVVFEALRSGAVTPDTPVVMSENAMAQRSLQAGLTAGRAMRLEDALYAVLVGSANEVAVALAETVGGSERRFVAMMNEAALRLGLTASHFVNPNGLDAPDQTVSARDLAILGIALDEEFPSSRDIVSTGRVVIDGKPLESHNTLLARFDGTVGMKTGFLCASGRNIVALAERNGRRIMVVLLGATTERERAERAALLMTEAFSGALQPTGQRLAEIGNATQSAPQDMRVNLCTDRAAAYEAERDLLYPMGLPGEESLLGAERALKTHSISTWTAPIPADVPIPTMRPQRGGIDPDLLR